MITRGKRQFFCMEVGCKGVYITRTCYHDENFFQNHGGIDICVMRPRHLEPWIFHLLFGFEVAKKSKR